MTIEQEIKILLNEEIDKKQINQKIKELEKIKKTLLKEKRTTPTELFNINSRRQLERTKQNLQELKAVKNDKVVFSFPNQTLKIKRSYLKSLKNPEKYVKGLYGRQLRRKQRKALENKDYRSVYGLSVFLKKIEQKQGVKKKEIEKGLKGFKPIQTLYENGLISKKERDKKLTELKAKQTKNSFEQSPTDELITERNGVVEIIFV